MTNVGIEDKIKKGIFDSVTEKAKEETRSLGIHAGVGAGIGLAYYAASWIFWPLAIIPLGPLSGALGGAVVYGTRKLYNGGKAVGLIGSEDKENSKPKQIEEKVEYKPKIENDLNQYNEEIEKLLDDLKKEIGKK